MEKIYGVAVKGTVSAVVHLDKTIEGVGNLATPYGATMAGIAAYQAGSAKIDQFKNGNANTKAEIIGAGVGEIFQLFGGEVAEAGKVGEVGKLGEVADDIGKTAKVVQTGTTVLGKFPDYLNLASELKARRFNIPSNIWNKMTPAEQWAANVKFLNRTIARGDNILLTNPVKDITKVTGYFRKELDYLIGKGYKLGGDGTKLIK